MAWLDKTRNGMGCKEEAAVTLPASAVIGYSSVIDFLKPRNDGTNQYVTIVLTPTAVTGTNLDISLLGAMTSGGDKFTLLDAPVADLTADATAVAGVIDINAYPAPFYYIGWTADVNESANTITVQITPQYN